jgi:hypothetical protein
LVGAPLFDDLVGAGEQRGQNGQTDRLSGLEVDDKFRFRGLFTWAKFAKLLLIF